MTITQGHLLLIGSLPRTVWQAGLKAAEDAGLVPALFFRTGQRTMAAVGNDLELTLFIRWTGNKPSRLRWTFDPDLFSPRLKASSKRAVAELLADQETPIRKLKLRGKTDHAVS